MMLTLVQRKEFTSDNITQEIAAEMCALLGLDSLFKNDEFKKEGYTVIDRWRGVSRDHGLSCTQHADCWNDPNHIDPIYQRAHHGVEILMNRMKDRRSFRIYSDGRGSCLIIYDKDSDWQYIARNGDYEQEQTCRYEYPSNQIKWVQLLLDYGFFTATLGKK